MRSAEGGMAEQAGSPEIVTRWESCRSLILRKIGATNGTTSPPRRTTGGSATADQTPDQTRLPVEFRWQTAADVLVRRGGLDE